MPKSYLADEPGCQRAAANRFDPYLQTWNRLLAYRRMGHPTAKIELIVLGGTWSFYPEAYQVWFVRRCLEALNDFGAGLDGRGQVAEFTAVPESSEWGALEEAQCANESSQSRCVGLALETRPDHVSAEEVLRIRRLGGTKVQVGVQSLSDEVLGKNRRGHDVAATRRALRLLRGAGFKLHVHWMPNLYGSSPAADIEDFDRLFSDPDFRPDEIKIYPCSLVPGVELERHYRSGAWRPYTHEELLEVLSGCLRRIPEYCRLTRLVRDIPSHYILAGNKLSNFREVVTAHLAEQGFRSRDIREREIRGRSCDPERLGLRSAGLRHFAGARALPSVRDAGGSPRGVPAPLAPGERWRCDDSRGPRVRSGGGSRRALPAKGAAPGPGKAAGRAGRPARRPGRLPRSRRHLRRRNPRLLPFARLPRPRSLPAPLLL